MMVTMLLMSLSLLTSLVSGYGVSGDEKCQDCVTIVTGLQAASMSNQSLTTQIGMILDMICPEAGLGGPDDHPNCEIFTQHHFPDLAKALFPHILKEEICYEDLGFCPSQTQRPKVVTCAYRSPGWWRGSWVRRKSGWRRWSSSPLTSASTGSRRTTWSSVTDMCGP